MRDPLDKEKFMGGNRQKWMGVLLGYSIIMIIFQIKYTVDPTPYIQFALTIGSLFILGGSVDSVMKINAAKSKRRKNNESTNTEDTTIPEN
jgi:hypothetical protein